MELLDGLKPPEAPRFRSDQVADGQQLLATTFGHNVSSLSDYYRDFANAVALKDWCRAAEKELDHSRLISDWQFLAARGAVVALYNYRMALTGIDRGIRRFDEWAALTERKKFDAAREEFKERFPNTTEMRQSILHSAELYQNEGKLKVNNANRMQSIAVSVDNCGIVIYSGGSLIDDVYETSFGGQTYHLPLTAEKILELRKITLEVFDAFERVPQ
ncbi:hypothetical protein [Qipengyuania sp.]|uniref:hypothetical protein n=1 Tax=Qipengyuania sp. TaxID=2004515 RepID=UPI003AF8080B